MKKLLFIIAVVLFSSCSTKELSDFRGCKYKVINSLFSSNTEIVITDDYAPIDIYIIILDVILDNKETKALKISITEDNIKYISKEDVAYIKENAVKISDFDTMLTAVGKSKIIVDRITQYEE